MSNNWSDRDSLPQGDPHDDVDEKDPYAEGYKKWKKDLEKYNKTMSGRLINPKGKDLSTSFGDLKGLSEICCEKPEKYKNVISKNLQFYACKNCGTDLGDVE